MHVLAEAKKLIADESPDAALAFLQHAGHEAEKVVRGQETALKVTLKDAVIPVLLPYARSTFGDNITYVS